MSIADDPSDAITLEAWRFMRRHFQGQLHFDEHLRALRYVYEPEGRLVAPVMVAMLEAVDTVLFVPDDSEGCMEIMVGLEPFDDRGSQGALADRWRIYHGEPDDVRWAALTIEAARFNGYILDGLALMRPNPIHELEPAICRQFNTERRDTLREALRQQRELVVEEPLLVGVDDLGFDVRGAFEVYRLEAPRPIDSPESAVACLEQMAATSA